MICNSKVSLTRPNQFATRTNQAEPWVDKSGDNKGDNNGDNKGEIEKAGKNQQSFRFL